MPRGEPSMLLTKLEKLLFLLRPPPNGREPTPPPPSSDKRFGFAGRSLSVFLCTNVSIRFCRAVKLADCLNPRESGLVADRRFGGFWGTVSVVFSCNELSMPRLSNGGPINSSELCSVREKRPEWGGRDLEGLLVFDKYPGWLPASTGDGPPLFCSREDEEDP